MSGLFNDVTLYAEVLLPLSVQGTFTYRVPLELNDEVLAGKRVMVQFGRKKVYSGLIQSIHEQPPKDYQAKYILAVLDDTPLVPAQQLRFWEWMSTYYLCTIGEVMSAALPSAFKMESQSKLVLRNAHYEDLVLDQAEKSILMQLERVGELTIDQADKLSGKKSTYKIIQSLYARGLIWINEELQGGYTPKSKTCIVIHPDHRDHADPDQLYQLIGNRAVVQLTVARLLLELDPLFQGVDRANFLSTNNLGPGAVKALVEKGILLEFSRDVDRIAAVDESDLLENNLTSEQLHVLNALKASFEEKSIALLQGVTASGKTHIYIRLIEETLARGEQVLYLLPEISLTTQLIQRLQAYFGNRIQVTHSRFNPNERAEVWYKILDRECDILLAPRSGIFMPFSNLGLIIIDEEHEVSFKQHEPNPRYHARDAAIVLAGMYKARVLLGSATPSLETYQNANSGKFGYSRLDNRFSGVMPPVYHVVDMREERRLGTNRGIFSKQLIDALIETRDGGQQSILFLNRKGYVPTTECAECSWTPKCIRCDISLTYYRRDNCLRCHFCGYQTDPYPSCPSCGGKDLRMSGYGTERIETELQNILPELRIQRFDQVTARTRRAYENIIGDFEAGKTDVLIGTQMLTKGLDFRNVLLVGILDADHALNFPDFRAYERSFQLMVQVGGRAGRRDRQGMVYIQTNHPKHKVISNVVDYDYDAMVQSELEERRKFHYPPYTRLVRITVKHKDHQITERAADYLNFLLRPSFGDQLLGPEEPFITRIRGLYQRQFLLKMETVKDRKSMKAILADKVQVVRKSKEYAKVRFVIDVDPM
ncbi:MAG: primosomal protein N' [Flavobacteriales bacterium]|nr:primosomal protein N' [Flavobacteriales bacterium]